MSEHEHPILMVLDDESAVCRAVQRMLRGKAGRVVAVETPEDAEAVFASTEVTHLICDHYLGPGQPLGADLAAAWRERYPTLKRVLILTGRDTREIRHGPEIDHVLPKTAEPELLLTLLGVDPRR